MTIGGPVPAGEIGMQVEHWDTAADGELSETALRRKLERRGYRVTRYVYPAGTCFPPHSHTVDKIDAVLAGRFRLVMQGRSAVLEAGDAIEVPGGVLHSAAVIGATPVVSLDAIKV
jgi:quercetin dioxygenase-like cupin family protein